jgi:hypothetical protein
MSSEENASPQNPLLAPLGPYRSYEDWAQALAHDPLTNFNPQTASLEEREMLLTEIDKKFEPTGDSLVIATTMQRMVRAGYRRRDPTDSACRLALNEILQLRGKSHSELLLDRQWRPVQASAFVIMGCTGTGKTTIVDRVLSFLPPVYAHGRSDTAGWMQQIQVPYLRVPMPAHRGGLLYSILQALDNATGKEYRLQYARWTIDKLTVEVGVLLAQHLVGMLIIEEMQPRNFSASPFLNELILMLLGLLNFGIPIIFIGNPLAFEGLNVHSQDWRRMMSEEPIELMPFAMESSDFSEGIAPGIWSHNVMPEQVEFTDLIRNEIFASSGGIADYAAKAGRGTQLHALHTGKRRVEAADIASYRRRSRAFQTSRDLIEGFAESDPWKLSNCVDVPWERYGMQWGVITPEDVAQHDIEGTAGTMSEEDKAAYSAIHKKIRSQNKARETSRANKVKANMRARGAAGQDDFRSGAKSNLSASLAELREETEKKESATT